MAQDGFVDLYEVLQVPPQAEESVLRARISAAYLEAQKNLDHRNAAKRLHFQQRYEVFLPQARHLLLDASRRAEYDRYLQAYRSGRPVEAATTPTPSASQSTDAPSLDVPEMTSPDVDPATLAAEREAMWDQWKSGLETPIEANNFSLPPDTNENNVAQTVAAPINAVTTSVAVAPTVAVSPMPQNAMPQNVAPRPVATRSWGNKSAPEAEQEELKRREEELERAREEKRMEIARVQQQTASIVWGFSVAGIVFVLVFALALWADRYFNTNNNYPLGLSRGSFTALSFALTLLLSGVAGWFGAQRGRR